MANEEVQRNHKPFICKTQYSSHKTSVSTFQKVILIPELVRALGHIISHDKSIGKGHRS